MPTFEQRLQRLELRLAELGAWRDRAVQNLEGWTFDEGPMAIGDRWPSEEGVRRLSLAEGAVPDGWPLAETRLELIPGGEGMLRLRYADGANDAYGITPWHQRFHLQSGTFSIEAEVVARRPFGQPSRNPTLESGRVVWEDPLITPLYRRLRLALEAAKALEGKDVAELLLDAADAAFRLTRLPTASREYIDRVAPSPMLQDIWSPPAIRAHPEPLPDADREHAQAALDRLATDLARIRRDHPAEGRLAVEGHAHIDLAWLWPLDETYRKAQRTFSTAVSYLDRYPEMIFQQSTAELYQEIKDRDPKLFERIREHVASGRWEPQGGMWVESDQNMPAGESLVRQLLTGQLWFEREFGARNTVGWLPDCFGFTPGMPQLYRSAGIESFFTAKLTWNETNRFPHDLWWWEGLDGSRVLVHSFTHPRGNYNGDPSPESTTGVWNRCRSRRIHPESLFTLGYGDGGGGMNEDMLLDMRAMADFPGLPTLEFGRADALFQRLHRTAAEREVPVWVGEMYLELHRGTLTTQGRLKRLHRRAERDLVAAETTYGLARLRGVDLAAPDLSRAWRLLLRNEFHDIIPGSSIAEVYERAERELSEAIEIAGRAMDANLDALAPAVGGGAGQEAALLVNPDLSTRPLRVRLDQALPGAQPVEGGFVATGVEALEGLSAHILLGAEVPPADSAARAFEGGLENGRVRLDLADDGSIASIHDKRAGRPVLDGHGNQLWAYVDKPRSWDAWDVDMEYPNEGEQLGRPESVEILEPGPHRAALRVRWRYHSSTITQDIRLWAGSARIEFATHIDWRDRRVLLKARFPLAVRSPRATFETAFGVTERPTHRNTSYEQARFEVAGHRFADLSEPGYGVALLNNGRYGHHILGNELGLSLLRSPIYPDPMADEGEHDFVYALLPHLGTWLEGGVLMEAEDLNRPLLARPCHAAGGAHERLLDIGGQPLGLGALKAAENGDGLILRLYEPQGGRGSAEVRPPEGWSLAEELNILEDPAGAPDLEFAPFQVRTYRLRGEER
ncbi:MAG TPA: glycoside hydrolase family 38 C-terminal domain-containing protein [Candidatus Dormibacteraeota bacterium]|nr:glycoside hydrolase family 38 C-terminal domain-containing protein [Candidatus Dormibacteraeota bacterium]